MTGYKPSETAQTDIERLARQLQHVQDRLSALERSSSLRDDSETHIRFLTEMMEMRRRRDGHFGRDLFGEPAWDLLLKLYLAEA